MSIRTETPFNFSQIASELYGLESLERQQRIHDFVQHIEGSEHNLLLALFISYHFGNEIPDQDREAINEQLHLYVDAAKGRQDFSNAVKIAQENMSILHQEVSSCFERIFEQEDGLGITSSDYFVLSPLLQPNALVEELMGLECAFLAKVYQKKVGGRGRVEFFIDKNGQPGVKMERVETSASS